jgi:predicted SprT family Zn-dependent metalloprotease
VKILATAQDLKKAYRLFNDYNQKYFEGKLPRYRIEFSDRFTRSTADINYSKKLIRLSSQHLERFGWKSVSIYLKHEMIHAEMHRRGMKPLRPHSTQFFKKWAEKLGTHVFYPDSEKIGYKYIYSCPNCNKEVRRRIKGTWSCRKCGGDLYNSKYKLEIKEILIILQI